MTSVQYVGSIMGVDLFHMVETVHCFDIQ